MAQPLANQVGKKMPAASADPTDARIDTTPDGRTARADVLTARNRTIASVAVPRSPLSLSSSSIALMPKGVAAFASPSMLAAMFMIMALIAGLWTGTPGKRRCMRGPTSRARCRRAPASSITRISPRKNAIRPTRPMASSTAPRADETMASVRTCIWPDSAARKTDASAAKTIRPFSMASAVEERGTGKRG